MIVYQKTKAEFSNDVLEDTLADQVFEAVQEKLGRKTSPNEVTSWRNSSMYVHNVLSDPRIPSTAGVALEYQIPSNSKRVDVIVSGIGEDGCVNLIVIELKQWSSAEVTSLPSTVKSFVGGAKRHLVHPSYQAATYAGLLTSFSAYVYENNVGVHPCAFLHNYPPTETSLTDARYEKDIAKAPLFGKSEGSKLADFISRYVKKGDNGEALYGIENGRIRPSKALADSLSSMLKGNKEFDLIDEQKIVYETTLEKIRSKSGDRNVIIVEGGPGTGKSVVAINLLVEATKDQLVAQYVTRNSAPRAVYRAMLVGADEPAHVVDALFKGSGSYINSGPKEIGLAVVDEAHRLNERTGMFRRGENQVKELIHASQTSIFFIDPRQRVTFLDIGSIAEIENWADYYNAEVTHMELPSQFRCAGSDGYLSWLDSTFGIRETANPKHDPSYDFRIFDDPEEMRKEIFTLNQKFGMCRMLAGYCWKWTSKTDPSSYDIEFPEHGFKMRWNDFDLGQGWIMYEEGAEQVGCIHTSQGLDANYVGVIIADDLRFEDGDLATYPLEHPAGDKNFSGLRGRLQDPTTRESTLEEAHELIINTYRTLLTRGMRGCFVYCQDRNLAEYLRSKLQAGPKNSIDCSLSIRKLSC